VTTFTFEPSTSVVARVSGQANRAEIHAETMFFGCSVEFIQDFDSGGHMARIVLDELNRAGELDAAKRYCKKHGKHLVIDTRSHMLMPGMYPAIPGWHCDAYPRSHYGEQPNLYAALPDTPHYVVHVSDQNGGVSRTLYAAEPITVEIDEDRVWGSWHEAAEREPIARVQYRDGEIVRMLQPTLHRAQRCYQKGWRWWFRMSAFYKPPENAVRKQVQVYCTEGGGW
jgi:hypothetical protein